MTLLIGFLTLVLVLTCLFLMLLILIQLPKKEAGAGIAFGGAATDALFGAGSGNALTKLTKYSAGIFVALSLVLSILNVQNSKRGTRGLEEELQRKASSAPRAQKLLPGTNLVLPERTVVPPVTPSNRVAAPAKTPAAGANQLQSTPTATGAMAAPKPAPGNGTAPKPGTAPPK